MPTVRETWDKMRQDALGQLKAAEFGEALLKDFPDLTIDINRWNTKRYSSALANPLTTDCEISHNCGCCSDSPLEVWPFVLRGGQKVFSNPARFTVGERNYWNGERPEAGWQEEMRAKQIPDAVIAKVRAYFDDNQPQPEEED